MPLFTYTTPLPVSGNNPSVDQPNMTVNNASVNSIIDVDHYSFNVNSGGLHKQSTYPVQSIPTTTSGQAAQYANTANSQSQLFATTDAGTNAYQMTRFNDSKFSLFGTITNNYNASGAAFSGGWTFLPGGLLFQYGYFVANLISSKTVPFPVSYTTAVFNIQLSEEVSDSSTIRSQVVSGSVGNSSFGWQGTSSSGLQYIYWSAIGK